MTKIRTSLHWIAGVAMLAGSIACGRSDVPAPASLPGIDPAFAGVVYPGARSLQAQASLMLRAQAMMNPNSAGSMKLALLDTADPFEVVLDRYAGIYEVHHVANNPYNDLSAVPPAALRFSGDVSTDVESIRSVLEALGRAPKGRLPATRYDGATFLALNGKPRASLQRPYYDPIEGRIVDRTLILLAE